MTISVNYQKRRNIPLFNKFQTNKYTNLTNIQNYIPIYDRFFALNSTNWNSINLNHQWYISELKDTYKEDDYEHIFNCKLKNTYDETQTISQKVFIKMAPLLDPFKYIVGKYNHTDPNLFNLPSFDKHTTVHPKLSEPNNSSFVDGFFAFLSSKLLHEHKFINGLDYYGSFLAIKNDYKINIMDDLDYLVQSDFFIKQQNILFDVENYSHLISNNEPKISQPLKISTSLKSLASVKSIDNELFEDIFDSQIPVNNIQLSLNDLKILNTDLVDITNSTDFAITNQHKTETLNSGSTCSSRTSHTNENDLSEFEDDNDTNTNDTNTNDNNSQYNTCLELEHVKNENGDNNDEYADKNAVNNDDDNNDEWEDEESETSIEEEIVTLTFPKFPVQVICMEQCKNTFDDLIINGNLTDDEWFSALMQIIMILITYQKLFLFTHNDLHTNNIMYVLTNKKFIYYTFNKMTYKVPTFGKIYKIIDFGRAIYKYNGKLFCSDSFQQGGDAATQYNTEPFFNDKKPRLEPNFSFDLCRLACSIFDYVVDDFESIKNIHNCSPLVKIIVEWCIDDNDINVLYKNNGVERYPDFKLYKMIARYVHRHTPVKQLERKEFSQFAISHKNIPKNEYIINIDDLPTYH